MPKRCLADPRLTLHDESCRSDHETSEKLVNPNKFALTRKKFIDRHKTQSDSISLAREEVDRRGRNRRGHSTDRLPIELAGPDHAGFSARRHRECSAARGTGEISVETADRATRYWTTRSDRDAGLNARTAGVYLRADPSDLQVLTAGAKRSAPS